MVSSCSETLVLLRDGVDEEGQLEERLLERKSTSVRKDLRGKDL